MRGMAACDVGADAGMHAAAAAFDRRGLRPAVRAERMAGTPVASGRAGRCVRFGAKTAPPRLRVDRYCPKPTVERRLRRRNRPSAVSAQAPPMTGSIRPCSAMSALSHPSGSGSPASSASRNARQTNSSLVMVAPRRVEHSRRHGGERTLRQLSRDAFCKWRAELFGLDHANVDEGLVTVSRLPCGHVPGGEQIISAIASIDDQDAHCVDLGGELHGGPESAAAHAPSRCVSTLLSNATGHNTPGVSFRRAQSGCTSRDGCAPGVEKGLEKGSGSISL